RPRIHRQLVVLARHRHHLPHPARGRLRLRGEVIRTADWGFSHGTCPPLPAISNPRSSSPLRGPRFDIATHLAMAYTPSHADHSAFSLAPLADGRPASVPPPRRRGRLAAMARRRPQGSFAR